MFKLFGLFSKENTCTLLETLQGKHAEKYHHFRELLQNNHTALSLMAGLEEAYFSGKPISQKSICDQYDNLYEAVSGIVAALEGAVGAPYPGLTEARDRIHEAVRRELAGGLSHSSRELVISLEEVTDEVRPMIGSKAGNLADISRKLGLPTPQGFAVTAYAFERFIEENGLKETIARELEGLASDGGENIERASRSITALIEGTEVPGDIRDALFSAYDALEGKTRSGVRIAMRSSAVGEDTEASFAGQYRSVLNVMRKTITDAYRTVIVSKYSARAIAYRLQYGLSDEETPMCVLGLEMVDPRASGVLYTVDPARPASGCIKINAVWGLGERLVDGSASADVFSVEKEGGIREKCVNRKELRLVNMEAGGTALESVPEDEREALSLDDATVLHLRDMAVKLQEHFECPQDVEWAVDGSGSLFILQSRPLHHAQDPFADTKLTVDEALHPVLLEGGEAACPGVASGKVFVAAEGVALTELPHDAILIARTASPRYAQVMGHLRGLITDMGSVTSHLASVAREFGVPALFDTKKATSVLASGREITLCAHEARVYAGAVEGLPVVRRSLKKPLFESPVFQRLRRILDHISSLNLTDPDAPSFSPEGCQTFHDMIRYAHEEAMRRMFAFGEVAERGGVTSFRLSAKIPLFLQVIDLGGGLRSGLTTCDTLTANCVESTPFRAIWQGFTHPGITWSGTVAFDTRNVMTLMAAGAMAEVGGGTPGGASYAIISHDYMNLSARFGYHFATVDALCGDQTNQNYVSLQFSGGVGPYYGRSLRISFLGNVLQRLGFEVTLKGDLIEAFLARYDRPSMEEKLDLLGRLLACTRLLDMAVRSQEQVAELTEAFFRGEYNFLEKREESEPRNFYIHTGHWRIVEEEGRTLCLQDGSKWGAWMSSGISGVMGKLFGSGYQEFLDNIEAYHYFPLMIARDIKVGEGAIGVRIKPVSGNIDRAGGVAFGIKDVCGYFVFRINALENNAILFEYDNCKRIERASVRMKIGSNQWHDVKVALEDGTIVGFVNDEKVMEYSPGRPLNGYIGLWTKADSLTLFSDFSVTSPEGTRSIPLT